MIRLDEDPLAGWHNTPNLRNRKLSNGPIYEYTLVVVFYIRLLQSIRLWAGRQGFEIPVKVRLLST
jgi:hypothetical protein